ncbi:hypothetical protein RRG08_050020 [Elysia crispata]|uniref:Phosphatidylinositol N-acetylglucosaminyltransferase subunit H conserved domain-containing protein n=1 Tax=Elysia crispata TaxID=231223 RepID=A0AAE1B985_9GAST|nr:hypothetical protein RRG08_050020 [Elysia crispata]
MSMIHLDAGKLGSEFTNVQPPIKSVPLLVILFFASSIIAFSFGMHLIDQRTLYWICLSLVVIIISRLYCKVYSESVLILPSLGLQVETHYYLGHVKTHFIDISHIEDIIINEAVTMHSILCYLVVLLSDTENGEVKGLYPLFSHSWPPLSSLKDVYRAVQAKLIKPNQR